MRTWAIIAALGLIGGMGFAADESWKLPLAEKEKVLEKNNVERHNILGLYPSQVDLPPDGGPGDNSSLGTHNIAHAVCWTANYLSGASYRYAFLKKTKAPADVVAKAKARADELFEAVYRCQLVTGVRGLQARGYAIGHGESYEERWGENTSDVWYQGAGEYSNLRWRGSPSHHNYSDAVDGLAQYYDLAAEGVQKDRCREAIDALVSYWVDNNFKIPHIDGKKFTDVLGFTDGKTLNCRVFMAIAGASTAYHATGNEKFRVAREKIVEKYHVRGMTEFKGHQKDFDDAEHVFCHLESLFRFETDPELLAAYRVVLDSLWEQHKDDAQTLFTYIYMGVTPNAPDRDKALKEALFSLQTYPTGTVFMPTMTTLLHPEIKPPYPVYLAAWDNEYLWKGSLLNGKAWLSRTITGVAVPEEDPTVIYAVDEKGDIYQSRDGAATDNGWRYVGPAVNTKALSIVAGPKVRMIFAVCDDGFRASLTGGYSWVKLEVPEEGGAPVALQTQSGFPYAVYAVCEKAVYRSEFRMNKELNKAWELVKEAPAKPEAANQDLQFKPGEGGVLKSADGGKTWETKSAGLDIPMVKSVFLPANTNWVFAGTPAGLYVSKDQGETWESGHLILQFVHNERRDLGGAAFIDGYWRGRYYGFIDDATAQVPWKEN